MPHTSHTEQQHRAVLQSIAHRAMLERGLFPTFSDAALAEAQSIRTPASANDATDADAQAIRDLTGLLWASIDNDDSRDLDQLTVAEPLPEDAVMIGWRSRRRRPREDGTAMMHTRVTTRPQCTQWPGLSDFRKTPISRH